MLRRHAIALASFVLSSTAIAQTPPQGALGFSPNLAMLRLKRFEAGERAAFDRLCAWGLTDAYRLHHQEPGRFTWWDYRAGNFHKNFGMRIDHLLVSASVAKRVVAAEIDREARKGKPIPSDHTPLVIDLDAPGHPFDAGWADAEQRIARRVR